VSGTLAVWLLELASDLRRVDHYSSEQGRARMAAYASNTLAGILIIGAALLAVVLVSGRLPSI